MINFNFNECNSMKSIAIKRNTTVDVMSRNVMIDVFCFPTLEVRNIYDRNGILKWHMYLNLTNTVSCLLFFIFICKLECCIKESKSRNLIFEVLKQSKMRKRLDVSHVLWEQFGMRDKSLKKKKWVSTRLKVLTMQIFVRFQ